MLQNVEIKYIYFKYNKTFVVLLLCFTFATKYIQTPKVFVYLFEETKSIFLSIRYRKILPKWFVIPYPCFYT